jgi:integrase
MKPYRSCSCRGPTVTGPDGRKRPGKQLGTKCPRLKAEKNHGAWFTRFEAPRGPDGKRRQLRAGPFSTAKKAKEAVVEALGKMNNNSYIYDRRTTVADHLDRQVRNWESATAAGADGALKPSTLESYREACELYLKPGLGHLRLADLQESHVEELRAALRKISRTEDDDRSELLRRLLAVRATWHGKRISTRPISEARITRVMAVLSSALTNLVPDVLPRNPARKSNKKRRGRKVRPLAWTVARTARWRETGEVPGKVMVWDADQCGQFLDAIGQHRLYALYHVAAYWGLRRSELIGLAWSDVDLTTRRIHVRQAQVSDVLDSTKSEDSERIIVIDHGTADVLRAWRAAQLAERLAWGPTWNDTGRVFTREDGAPVRPGWVSERFGTLAAKAGLPPVTFHGLRHGTATMLLAAGQPPKVISEVLGHSTVSFTMTVYTEVAESLAESAASAIAAFVPRSGRMSQQ